jgi:hypothetical protein
MRAPARQAAAGDSRASRTIGHDTILALHHEFVMPRLTDRRACLDRLGFALEIRPLGLRHRWARDGTAPGSQWRRREIAKMAQPALK